MGRLCNIALPAPDTNKWRTLGIGGSHAAFGRSSGSLLAFGLIQGGRDSLNAGAAPDFTLNGFDGRSVALSQLHGQVVVINFWASWCPPCREEAAYLEQTWR